MKIAELLGKKMLFFDGALGTGLQAMGLAAGEEPALWNLTQPEKLFALHSAFLAAGCDIITANTFGANSLKLRGAESEDVISAALGIVRRAIDVSGREAFAALDIGSTGQFLEPFGTLPFSAAYDSYAQMVRAAVTAGADCVVVETMSDTLEMKAAVLAVKENSDLPVFASFSPDANGRLLMGGGMDCCAALLEDLAVDAIGLNCGVGPAALAPFVQELAVRSSTPLFVMPNAGLPQLRDGVSHYDVAPEEFAAQMRDLIAPGVCMLGGCCGTTPEHLEKTIALCAQVIPTASQGSGKYAASYARAVNPNEVQAVDIIPAGEAAGDADTLLSAALDKMDEGAQLLRIALTLPAEQEIPLLQALIPNLQMVCPLPLWVVSTHEETLKSAARVYNGALWAEKLS